MESLLLTFSCLPIYSYTDRKKLSQQAPSLRQHLVAANSAPDIPSGVQTTNSHATNNSRKHIPLPPIVTTGHANAKNKKGLPPPRGVSTSKARRTQEAAATASSNTLDIPDPQISSLPSSSRDDSNFEEGIPVPPKTNSLKASDKASDRSQPATPRVQLHSDDDGSVVSSITGAGYDQEIVEELHMALTELRAELEESRAEAARAVKVAEQAIQSAENSSSKDWNSTVTHKAAEAAALAQKKSAEAMAKARLAEERLEGERKNGSIWRKQAEAAEEEAGHWQTRAAAAEVQRAAISEGLGSERKKAAMLLASMKQRFTSSETYQRDAFEATMERNRTLELELEVLRESLSHKNDEVVTLQDCLSEV
jgi:DNA-binding XRE family transcriptional regulator